MTADISPATPSDVAALVDLFREMDEFYGEPASESSDSKARNIREALFAAQASAYALVARDDDGRVIGLACYSFLWPATLTSRSLYLKELYVSQERRRAGTGDDLMRALFAIAKASGCTRVEWTTDNDNEIAKSFYLEMGFRPKSSKIFYRADVT